MLKTIIKRIIYSKKNRLRASKNYILLKKKNSLNKLNFLKELIINILSKDKSLYQIDDHNYFLKNNIYKRVYKLLINKHFNFFFLFFLFEKTNLPAAYFMD